MERSDNSLGHDEPKKDLVREYRWDLAAIVEASDDAIIGTDLEGNVISWNSGAERMYGYSEQEMVGRSIALIVPPDRLDSFLFRLARLRSGEQITNFETERIGRNGRRLFVSISVFPVRDEAGTPIGIASITRNITALKRAEERIRRSEERYRAIIEDQTEMICRSLPDTTLTFVNESYARYFGKPTDELLGKRFIDFLPSDDAAAMRTFLDSFTPDNPVATSEHRVVRDGHDSELWQQWTDRAIYDNDGNLVEFQSVGRDITERKLTEKALMASEELNRAVLGSLRDQIAVLDRDGTIIAVNEGWTEFSRANDGNAVGLGINYLDVCIRAGANDSGLRPTIEGIVSVVEKRSPQYREEYVCETPTGKKWFVMSVTPLRLPEGGAVVSHIDVTERKTAEAALIDNREELRKSRDETQQLAARLITLQEEERARVAAELHDGIGQSLAIIRNRVKRCLGETHDAGQVSEQLEEISEAVTAAIDEVREIAYGLRPYELDRLGLKNAVESMVERIGDSAPIKISADLDDVSGILDESAETNIYRVVQEALHNVIDHSRAASASVRIKLQESVLHIAIADDGIGLQPKSDGARTGFGLSGIEERARMLGGTINVVSADGKGTTIDLRIGVGKR